MSASAQMYDIVLTTDTCPCMCMSNVCIHGGGQGVGAWENRKQEGYCRRPAREDRAGAGSSEKRWKQEKQEGDYATIQKIILTLELKRDQREDAKKKKEQKTRMQGTGEGGLDPTPNPTPSPKRKNRNQNILLCQLLKLTVSLLVRC